MFFTNPQPTAFDLRWTMFGIPIRVHPSFWLTALLLGLPALYDGIHFLLLWVVCVFVSVLIHELGHAVTGMLFGSPGQIVLYSFGGVAIGSTALGKRWQRILVLLAGPFAGFLFFALILAGYFLAWIQAGGPERIPMELSIALWYLLLINLFWGFVNLAPVWPLDGGQVSREVLSWMIPRNGVMISLGISIGVAAVLAIASFVILRSIFMPIFFGLMAFQSYQMMQVEMNRGSYWDDRWG